MSKTIDILPLIRGFWPSPGNVIEVTAEEVSLAISHVFTDSLSPYQTATLLACLNFTGWDRRADVIAACASAMREAAAPIDLDHLRTVIKARGKPEGNYNGGLVSISKSCITYQLD